MNPVIRLASSPGDYALIRRMNNAVFACEIGQHQPAEDGLLVDPFESRSRFLLALDGDALLAMVSFHSDPPYSVEKKLSDPAVLDTLPQPITEIRLLAVQPAHRGTPLLTRLLVHLFDLLVSEGVRTIVISAISSRLQMYEFMGFRAIGPPVRSGAADFVPMALDVSSMPPAARAVYERYAGRADS